MQAFRASVRLVGWMIAFAPALALLGQEEGKKEEPAKKEAPDEPPKGEPESPTPKNSRPFEFESYMELLEVSYASPEQEGGSQAIHMKFNISPEVPKGTVIRLTLEHYSLPVDETTYTLKDENRKGLAFTWKPKNRLVTGEYDLRSHIDLELEGVAKQTPNVQRLIKQNTKRFPPKSHPWSWYFGQQKLTVGSKEDEAAESEQTCKLFSDLMDQLSENLSELKAKMDAIKEGKELVVAKTLDKAQFDAFVLEWIKKQGEIQKEILQLQVKEPVLVQKFQTAFVKLQNMGKMVSRRASDLQKEVTEQFKLPVFNPATGVHPDYDKRYRYKVTPELLQSTYESIRKLVNCPAEEEGTEGADPKPAAEPDAKAEGEKAESTPSEGGDEKQAAEKKEAEKQTDKKGADKKAAKKPAKK